MCIFINMIYEINNLNEADSLVPQTPKSQRNVCKRFSFFTLHIIYTYCHKMDDELIRQHTHTFIFFLSKQNKQISTINTDNNKQ